MIADRDQSGDMGWSEFLWFVTFLKCEYLQSLGRMKKFRFESPKSPAPAVKEDEVLVVSESLAVSVEVPRAVSRAEASKPPEPPKIADFSLGFGLFCSHGDESKEAPDADLSRALDSLDVLARTPRERMEVELAQVNEHLAQLQSRKGELEAALGSESGPV